jgi:Flp pilus assembly secretin CpaC
MAAIFCLCAAAPAQDPQQISVSVKIIEFQTVKGVETGLSAYFAQRNEPRPYGRISSGNGNIRNADLTFPTSTNAGITVFLDRISTSYGDIEMVLQALVDQNRAFILARPKAMVPVGVDVPTLIETTQAIPYEDTRVVGSTAVQITSFRDTGVKLMVKALQVIDDDGNPNTKEDSFIQLELEAAVNEEGQRITVALDDFVAGNTGPFSGTTNAISVPEFISRSIKTTVWVRNEQVLILGGLYRNTKSKSVTTLPWLTQGEDFLNSVVQRVVPFTVPGVPLTTGLGNQDTDESRRELVFLIKADVWRPSYTVVDEFGFDEGDDDDGGRTKVTPGNVINEVIEGISVVPQGIVEGIKGESESGVSSSLGGSVE